MANQSSTPSREIKRVRVLRMTRIQEAIESGKPYNAVTLGKELEETPRRIRDDIRYMVNILGHRIDFDYKRNCYFYLEKSAPVASLRATEMEVTALHFAKTAAPELSGTMFDEPLISGVNKMTASLAKRVSFSLHKWEDIISFHTTVRPIMDPAVFETLAKAAADRQQLRMKYRKPGPGQKVEERIIDPYHLPKINGEWYFIAFDQGKSVYRTFTPIRIKGLEPTGVTFVRRRDFSLSKILRKSFGVFSGDDDFEVTIEFNENVADYIRERNWPCQTAKREMENGGVELKLNVSTLAEVNRWLLTWCGNAVPTGPRELLVMGLEAARNLVKSYEERLAALDAAQPPPNPPPATA